MNIDERIEKLTERTEALTQSVELLSHLHQDNEKRNNEYFRVISESLQKLTSIAESHEARISDLEGHDSH